MPNLPKSRKRPWIPEKPKHERQFNNQKFYSSKQWRALRNYFIQKNPLCAQCKRNGITKGGQVIDHIKPIRLGGHPTAESNLQTLCNKWHDNKSGMEGSEYRKGIKAYKIKKND